jgi:hypothetical protein
LTPLANVEDAVVEVTLSRFVLIPPANVEVAVVVASNTAAVVVPTTESFEYGDVVPMPTLPVDPIAIHVFVPNMLVKYRGAADPLEYCNPLCI